MKKSRILLLLVLGLLVGGAAVGAVGAYRVAAQGNTPTAGSPEQTQEEAQEQEASKALAPLASITEAHAREIAQKRYTGSGKPTEVVLENKKGVLVYGVEFTEADGNEVDVYVDAKSGLVVGIEDDRTEQGDD